MIKAFNDFHLLNHSHSHQSLIMFNPLSDINLFCASTSLTDHHNVVPIYIRVKLHFHNPRLRKQEQLQSNDCSIINKTKHAQACL